MFVVAHVQVTARHDNQRMPKGITDNPNLQNTRYEIKYIQMFKVYIYVTTLYLLIKNPFRSVKACQRKRKMRFLFFTNII